LLGGAKDTLRFGASGQVFANDVAELRAGVVETFDIRIEIASHLNGTIGATPVSVSSFVAFASPARLDDLATA
jgi:hypothetical protein